MALREKQAGTATIVPVNADTGNKKYSDLLNNVRTFWLCLTARATLTLAGGPATVIRNRGSLWSAFSQVGVEENGVDKVNLDGRLLRAISEAKSGRQLSATRQTVLANGATVLTEHLFVNFSSPMDAGPAESVFMERDPRQALRAFVVYNGDNAVPYLITTPGTAVLSNVSVTVQQMTDDLRAQQTHLIPFVRQLQLNVAAGNTDLPLHIRTSRVLGGIMLQQDGIGFGEVTDIINSVALRGDTVDYIGPKKVRFDDLRFSREQEFGAEPGAAYAFINTRRGGRLSNEINPVNDTNLRLEFDCQPSVTVGVTSSIIRAALIEHEKVAGLSLDTLPYNI